MKDQYEITCLDECGHEMVLATGSRDYCKNLMKTVREDYPECRNFSLDMKRDYHAEAQARYDNDTHDLY